MTVKEMIDYLSQFPSDMEVTLLDYLPDNMTSEDADNMVILDLIPGFDPMYPDL